MKSFVLFIVLCISFSASGQQKLVFTNPMANRSITIKQKDLVRLGYSGYMKQAQEAEGVVSILTDSSITLSPRKKFLQKARPAQVIMLRDVTGFRRFSRFRVPGEVIYAVLSVGVTGTVTAIISSSGSSAAMGFVSAAATQTFTTALRNVFFSSKIKDHLGQGWTMKVQPGK
jgi:hypothetical protein